MKKVYNLPVKPDFFATGDTSSLVNFYKLLGWDDTTINLNPTKLKLNKDDLSNCAQAFIDSYPPDDRMAASMFWMNYGPSTDKDVRLGKMHIEKGFMTNDSGDNIEIAVA